VHYGWGPVIIEDVAREVTFEIRWYDLLYFQRRKHAYTSKLHQIVLRQFGVTPEDLEVIHHEAVDAASDGRKP
jgi:hypothetical protein